MKTQKPGKTLFKLFLSIFILASVSPVNAQYALTYQNTEPNNGVFQRIAVDVSGNSYYTGGFSDSLHLGSITVYKSVDYGQNPNTLQYFVAKMDAGGIWVWAKSIPVTPLSGGSATITISNVAADNSGNSYITGTFRGRAVFGGTTINSPTYSNSLFAAKINSSGSFVWAVSTAPKFNYATAWGRGIAVDASGNVCVTGYITTKTGSPELQGMYWAKYNSSGTRLWENTLSPSGGYATSYSVVENQGNEVSIDGSGNIYITGMFHGSIKFANGAGNTISSLHKGAFVVKLNSNGTYQWVRAAVPSTPNSSSNPKAISTGLYIDATGNIHIGGLYSGANLQFQGTAITLNNPTTANYGFIAKYSSTGVLAWALNTADSISSLNLFKELSGNAGVLQYRKGATSIAEYNASGSLVNSITSTDAGVLGMLNLQDAAHTSTGYMLCGNVKGTTTLDNLALSGTCPLSGGCSYSDMIVVTYSNGFAKTTGVTENNTHSEQLLEMYPNPVKDFLQIIMKDKNDIGNLTIYDQAGRKVWEENVTGNRTEIDTRSLDNGMYFLQVKGATWIRFLKAD